MSYEVMHIAGKFLKHAVGILLLCWRRVFKTAAVVSVVAFLAVEILAVVVTHSFPPPGAAHLVACAFALATAYGAAMTVFLDELVVGMIESVAMLEGNVAAEVRSVAIAGEREIGDLRAGLGHWFGRGEDPVAALARVGVSAPVAAAAAALGSSLRASSYSSREPAPEPPEERVLVAEEPEPRPVVDAPEGDDDNTLRAVLEPPIPPLPMQQRPQPVRADQLPRIRWATEADPATEPSLPALPRLVPVRTVPLAESPESSPIDMGVPVDDLAQTLPDVADDELATPLADEVAPAEQPSPAGPVADADAAPVEAQQADTSVGDAQLAGGVWQRLSQALSGVSPGITLPGKSVPRDDAAGEPDEPDEPDERDD